MNKNGLKLIAIGIALSNEDRKRKVKLLNDSIDSFADSIRSTSDLDGMPHGTKVGDPVSAKVAKMEKLEIERDIEQERINAVEWAMQNATDLVPEEEASTLEKAIMMSIRNKKGGALTLIDESTIKPATYYTARTTFLSGILRYLQFDSKSV